MLLVFIIIVTFAILSTACAKNLNEFANSADSADSNQTEENIFDRFLQADFEPADGFDFPIGDADAKGSYTDKATGKSYTGWSIATNFAEKYELGIHPGEDWNGAGGGNTDLGQNVYAVANGRVAFADHCGKLWGNVVILEHIFYENNQRKKIRSLYAHLNEIKVKKGEKIKRRQIIATIGQDPDKTFLAHLHLELRWNESLPPTYWASSDGKDVNWVRENYAAPTDFINSHRKLFVPQKEKTLVLVDQKSYKMRLYKNGEKSGEYDVSFGQSKGAKQIEGDNKTPIGMYFVIEKHRGKFDGEYGAYYGGHWIKVNYPNKYDAVRGLNDKLIDQTQAQTITANWNERKPTPQNTKLGSGIGFHGWIREWENEGPRHLSWGCVVMHIYDIKNVFDKINEGAMVVIF